jgi:hypothetical protein
MGSDDGVKAWLNGQLVFDQWNEGGVAPREKRVPVKLAKGWNDLMLKVVDQQGGWAFCCRIRKPTAPPWKGCGSILFRRRKLAHDLVSDHGVPSLVFRGQRTSNSLDLRLRHSVRSSNSRFGNLIGRHRQDRILVNPLENHQDVLVIRRVAEYARPTARLAGLLLPRVLEHEFDVSRGQVVFVDMFNVSVRLVVPNDS